MFRVHFQVPRNEVHDRAIFSAININKYAEKEGSFCLLHIDELFELLLEFPEPKSPRRISDTSSIR